MFSKVLIASSLVAFVAATIPASQCNVDDLTCCSNVQPASAEEAQSALGALGIVVQDLNVPVGIACNPISVIGAGASSNCAAQPVCCEDNNYNGAVAIGCTPVNLGL